MNNDVTWNITIECSEFERIVEVSVGEGLKIGDEYVIFVCLLIFNIFHIGSCKLNMQLLRLSWCLGCVGVNVACCLVLIMCILPVDGENIEKST